MREFVESCAFCILGVLPLQGTPPAPDHDLLICAEENLGELAVRWASELGVVLSLSPETEQLLERSSTGLRRDLRVPRPWANAMFGALLAEHAFQLHPVSAMPTPVFALTSMETSLRDRPRAACTVSVAELEGGQLPAALEVEVRATFEHLDAVLVQRDLPNVLPSHARIQVLAAGHEAWIRGSAADVARLVRALVAGDRAAGGVPLEELWRAEPWEFATTPQCELAWHPQQFTPTEPKPPTLLELLVAWSEGTGHAVVISEECARILSSHSFEAAQFAIQAPVALAELDARLTQVNAGLELLIDAADPEVPRLYAVRCWDTTDRWRSLGSVTGIADLGPEGSARPVATVYLPLERSAYTLVELLQEHDSDRLDSLEARVVPIGPRLVFVAGAAHAVESELARLRELDQSREATDERR